MSNKNFVDVKQKKRKWYNYLDPFLPYDIFIEYLTKKNLSNKYSNFIIFVIYALILAFLLLKVLALILGAHEAAMIVVSGSMQPYLGIGDVVVLHSSNEINTTYIDVNANIKNIPIRKYLTPIYAQDETIGYPVISDLNILGQIVKPNKTADVVVYYSDLEKKEIIHRAILGINANDGTFYITQGDNKKTNFVLDSDCDAKFQTPTGIITINCLYPYALQKENILSKYFFNIPYIGWIKLAPVYLFGWRP